MDSFSKDQFKKLTNEEKNKVISDLVLHPEEILCKSTNELFVVKPLEYKHPRLFVEFAQKEIPLKNGEDIICQFLFKGESLYIFRGDYSKEISSPCLSLTSDFYMIQRRQNYRLKFPGSLSSKVLIKHKGQTLVGKVFDLSTSGIRVSTTKDSEHLIVGDQVDMEIQVVGHQPVFISAHMRHRIEGTEMVNEKKIPSFYYGFQFTNLTIDNEKSLSRINMELYRNFFQKVGS